MMKIVTQKMLVGQGLRGFIGFWADFGMPEARCHPERNAKCRSAVCVEL